MFSEDPALDYYVISFRKSAARFCPSVAYSVLDTVFPNAGAYCATEGVSLFLSRDLPAVYLADGEGAPHLVRSRIETDYLNTPQS